MGPGPAAALNAIGTVSGGARNYYLQQVLSPFLGIPVRSRSTGGPKPQWFFSGFSVGSFLIGEDAPGRRSWSERLVQARLHR